jgi:hypothetical protein
MRPQSRIVKRRFAATAPAGGDQRSHLKSLVVVLVSFFLTLDFPKERLVIDPIDGITLHDNGSIEAALYSADIYRFLGEYFANGSLEVWDHTKSECLGRCSPFIPVNIDLRATIKNFGEIEKASKEEADRRRKKDDQT